MGLLEQQQGLLPATANPKMLAQALKARQQPRTQLNGQGLLDTAAIGLSPIPVIGDVLGLGADASRFYNEPESRTPMNFGLAALGLIPFVPSAAGKLTKQEKAHRLAQKNAALPVEQGGLGLPPNNTAADRAKAMGFDKDVYHGTNADIAKFDPKQSAQGGITWIAENPKVTEEFIRSNAAGGNIMPLKANMGKTAGWNEYDKLGIDELAGRGYQSTWLPSSGGESTGFVMNPNQLRSRFAAFDPKRKNSSDLLANVAPFGLAGLLGLGLYDAKQGD